MNRCTATVGRLLGLVLWGTLAVAIAAPVVASTSPAAPDVRVGQVEPRVLATEVATPITPVTADHIEDGLEQAANGGHTAYVIVLDTPGGLVEAMRDVVADILASEVPVIVYVSPEGARAASAGAVITLAAHVAVMAPGTTIGAATPVGLEGEEVSDKVVNDLAAQAEALARLRGRDVGFASDIVREGRAVDVEEAVELGAVDARAIDLADAIAAADGRRVTIVGDRSVLVRTAGAVVERHEMGPMRRVLQALADPNIAFLLLTLGTLGLIYELTAPGIGVAGVTGLTALLLAMFSLSLLPVNVVGLLLLAVAAGLFVAEVFAPGVAGFGFGGAVVLVLAAVFLFDDSTGVAVDPWAAIPLAALMFVLMVAAGRVALHTRRAPSTTTGTDALVGRVVDVRDAEGAEGSTHTQGSWWSLRSTGPPLTAGGRARVVDVDGLTLLVEPEAVNQERNPP